MDSRRERNKREKQARIFDAASALFTTHGYAAVTTQQVADRADVAAGTLFRYAATKAELLLMVLNDRIAEALDAGRRDAAEVDDADAAVMALLAPLLSESRRNAENTAVYQREVMFGPGEPYRTEAFRLVRDYAAEVAAVLRRTLATDDDRPMPDSLPAARAVMASVQLAILAAARPDPLGDPLAADLAPQVALIVRGYAATASRAQEGATS